VVSEIPSKILATARRSEKGALATFFQLKSSPAPLGERDKDDVGRGYHGDAISWVAHNLRPRRERSFAHIPRMYTLRENDFEISRSIARIYED